MGAQRWSSIAEIHKELCDSQVRESWGQIQAPVFEAFEHASRENVEVLLRLMNEEVTRMTEEARRGSLTSDAAANLNFAICDTVCHNFGEVLQALKWGPGSGSVDCHAFFELCKRRWAGLPVPAQDAPNAEEQVAGSEVASEGDQELEEPAAEGPAAPAPQEPSLDEAGAGGELPAEMPAAIGPQDTRGWAMDQAGKEAQALLILEHLCTLPGFHHPLAARLSLIFAPRYYDFLFHVADSLYQWYEGFLNGLTTHYGIASFLQEEAYKQVLSVWEEEEQPAEEQAVDEHAYIIDICRQLLHGLAGDDAALRDLAANSEFVDQNGADHVFQQISIILNPDPDIPAETRQASMTSIWRHLREGW